MGESKISQKPVSGYTSGIGDRINEISRRAGGKRRLAEMAGLSESQLHRITSGESQAKIENVAAMAINCGVSIDWLATGRGAAGTQGVAEHAALYQGASALLRDVLIAVEKILEEHALPMAPEKKAEMILLLYDFSQAKGKVDDAAVGRLLRLVTG